MKRIFFLLLISFIVNNTNAQFIVKGEFRPRYEFRDGYKKLPSENSIAANLVTQRSRIILDYKSKNYSVGFTLQDYRIWGEESLKNDSHGLGVFESWVSLNITDSLEMKVGRQQVSFDNKRLLSCSEWNQKGMSHDAVVVNYHHKSWDYTLGGAFNQSKDTLFGTAYNVNGNYKAIGFAWLTRKIRNFSFNVVCITDGIQRFGTQNTVYVRVTHGGGAEFKKGNFSTNLRTYYQSGQYETGAFIHANYVNFDIEYSFFKKYNLKAGCDFLSGQDSTNKDDNKVHSFNTLYGSCHNFNGNMDYFTKPSDTKYAGLIDLYADFSRTGEKFTPGLKIHYLMLQNNLPDKINGGNYDPFLAWEADLSLSCNLMKEVKLIAGYSVLTGSETLESISNSEASHISHWAYMMMTIKPEFFRTK